MLAEKDPIFKEVATQVKELTGEEKIRMQCEAREDYYRTQQDVRYYYESQLNEKDKALAEKNREIAKLKEQLSNKES